MFRRLSKLTLSLFSPADLSSRSLRSALPTPDRIPLPDLAPTTITALQAGERSSQIFNSVLKQCETFYTTVYPSMSSSPYYQSIGRRMVEKYPSLAYAHGKTPWVSLSWLQFISLIHLCLFQRCRTNRFQNNAKSTRPAPKDSEDAQPQKLFKMANKLSGVTSEKDFASHLDEIKKEWEGKQSITHLQTLLKQTRQFRKEWQTTLKTGKIEPILEKFPCFEEGCFLVYEFFCQRSDDPEKAREEIVARNMEWIMHTVVSKKTAPEGTDAEKASNCSDLQKLVSKQKGKGLKSKTCITIVNDVKSVETVPQKHLHSQVEEAPHLVVFLDSSKHILLVVFLDSPKHILCQFIVGDNVKIFLQTQSLFDAVISLLGSYYVFDLEYPPTYCQVLGLVQHWVVSDIFTGSRTSNCKSSVMN
ncbi:LOW QUALITY PROTEIN: uncharacterized protein LOC124276509 [Haliotis rubra]|uniref:LOW QUALITY PROTEIN: uncharacterized protein LOC124276509 n=1 Tax=Haliotis rubra TaxID=36100 RepID=UPI001EE629CA|nr:LOW QUALITY PROTEIN: uncharacterized protein LOC124276509 [Haliotis rubra]